MSGRGSAEQACRLGRSVRTALRSRPGYRMGMVWRQALSAAMSPRDQRRQPMMEVFELGGIAAAVVAAYQSHLLQALLTGPATPATYAEELGLDATATERILDVLAQLGAADCDHGRYTASTGLSQLDAPQ